MNLWLCLRFTQLPLQCLTRDEQRPAVVLAAQRVLCASDSAAALGIAPGMSVAAIHALAGAEPVQMLSRDKTQEARCLEQLCHWAYSITPSLHAWRDDCLQLEIGGCLNLFRGLDALLNHVYGGLDRRRLSACPGLAPTPKAAWLLSHTDGGAQAADAESLEARLAPLPLALLAPLSDAHSHSRKPSHHRVDSLRRAGLHTLGDVFALPPAALGRRCGETFVQLLQEILGQRRDRPPDYRPPRSFSETYCFGYELRAGAELLPAAQCLLESLCRFLYNSQLQTGEILWCLVGTDRTQREVCVRSASNSGNWHHWYQLSQIHFTRLQTGAGVEDLTLRCDHLQPGQLASLDLFSPHSQRESLSELLDRLRSRLGLQAIERLGCRDEHLPELALSMGNEPCDGDSERDRVSAQRPFWLLPAPQPLRRHGSRLYWRGALTLLYGPERIEDNWWREAVSRDYYIATDIATDIAADEPMDRVTERAAGKSGQRYWIFHDRLSDRWYVQGIFA